MLISTLTRTHHAISADGFSAANFNDHNIRSQTACMCLPTYASRYECEFLFLRFCRRPSIGSVDSSGSSARSWVWFLRKGISNAIMLLFFFFFFLLSPSSCPTLMMMLCKTKFIVLIFTIRWLQSGSRWCS